MAEKKISRSAYTIRKRDRILNNGDVIYENDITTFDNVFTDVNGYKTFAEGNFIVVASDHKHEGKLNIDEDWDSDFETLETIGSTNITTTEETTYETAKLDTDDLTSFGYFGSLYQMFTSTIAFIYNNFPASIYVQKSQWTKTTNGGIKFHCQTGCTNPFGVNVFESVKNDKNIINPYRYFIDTYKEYIVSYFKDGIEYQLPVTGYTNNATNGNIVIYTSPSCPDNVDINIRPNDSIANKFFNNDDFPLVKLLLKRDTYPVYTSRFRTIIEDEDGVYEEMREITWPTADDGLWNPSFEIDETPFLKTLEATVEMYEHRKADNAYRMLTYSSLKDYDYLIFTSDEIREEGIQRTQELVRLFGASFDRVKRCIDEITTTNNVTYDQKNNVADCDLIHILKQYGWVNTSLENFIGDSVVYKPIGPTGSTNSLRYTSKDIESHFRRKLAINTPYINRSKGTLSSVKMMMSMLGIPDDWYKITELVANTSAITGFTLNNGLNFTVKPSRHPSNVSISDIYQRIFHQDTFNITNNFNELTDEDFTHVNGALEEDKLYPYLKSVNSEKQYYQMAGGWFDSKSTLLNNRDINGVQLSDDRNIQEGNNPHFGNNAYDYGMGYLETFEELFFNEINKENVSASAHYFGYGFHCSLVDGGNKISNGDNYCDINLKNIVFGINVDNIPKTGAELNYILDYINTIVFYYVKQLLPCTSIVTVYPYSSVQRHNTVVFSNNQSCQFTLQEPNKIFINGDAARKDSCFVITSDESGSGKISVPDYEKDGYRLKNVTGWVNNQVPSVLDINNTINFSLYDYVKLDFQRIYNITAILDEHGNDKWTINYTQGETNKDNQGEFINLNEIYGTEGIKISCNNISGNSYKFVGWFERNRQGDIEEDIFLTDKIEYVFGQPLYGNRFIVGKFDLVYSLRIINSKKEEVSNVNFNAYGNNDVRLYIETNGGVTKNFETSESSEWLAYDGSPIMTLSVEDRSTSFTDNSKFSIVNINSNAWGEERNGVLKVISTEDPTLSKSITVKQKGYDSCLYYNGYYILDGDGMFNDKVIMSSNINEYRIPLRLLTYNEGVYSFNENINMGNLFNVVIDNSLKNFINIRIESYASITGEGNLVITANHSNTSALTGNINITHIGHQKGVTINLGTDTSGFIIKNKPAYFTAEGNPNDGYGYISFTYDSELIQSIDFRIDDDNNVWVEGDLRYNNGEGKLELTVLEKSIPSISDTVSDDDFWGKARQFRVNFIINYKAGTNNTIPVDIIQYGYEYKIEINKEEII